MFIFQTVESAALSNFAKANNIDAKQAKQIILNGITARLSPGKTIAPQYEDKVINIFLDSISKLSHICDLNRCLQDEGAFKAAALSGISGDMNGLFNELRVAANENEKRVFALTKAIKFLYENDYRGHIEHSSVDDAYEKLSAKYKVDKAELAELLSSDRKSHSISVVSKENGKAYIVKKGFKENSLVFYEANGKTAPQEYIQKRLDDVTNLSSYLAAVYVGTVCPSDGKFDPSMRFKKDGVTEILLGSEQVTLKLGQALNQTMEAIYANKYLSPWTVPKEQAVSSEDSKKQFFAGLNKDLTNYASIADIKKEHDTFVGVMGAYENFAKTVVSPIYERHVQGIQSMQLAQRAAKATNEFVQNAILTLQNDSELSEQKKIAISKAPKAGSRSKPS